MQQLVRVSLRISILRDAKATSTPEIAFRVGFYPCSGHLYSSIYFPSGTTHLAHHCSYTIPIIVSWHLLNDAPAWQVHQKVWGEEEGKVERKTEKKEKKWEGKKKERKSENKLSKFLEIMISNLH
jgi:hypothetical protein